MLLFPVNRGEREPFKTSEADFQHLSRPEQTQIINGFQEILTQLAASPTIEARGRWVRGILGVIGIRRFGREARTSSRFLRRLGRDKEALAQERLIRCV